ncbi:THUMP domain-containing protein 3 isoform X1 [Lampris incognitus]|uniref:THUMP domain-containing protein 3 isoform X1 n=1 Tax=Lampris incognitus TaxID=2546036 RepID=UPI0024B4CDAF|nr:THUMP domain-containing protein 3 isoform X1 [Lampris incognitus]XP_056130871.1 THUMP domain-containing protein 3 isoform X1 [Lampris incognitus]
MSSEAEADPHRGPTSSLASTGEAESGIGAGIVVTVGATVPTGFEHTAAEEIRDKIGADARISKNRGRIYFQISTDKLAQVHLLRSVDNLFVVVEEFEHYQFQESKEETLTDLQQLASKLSWTNALEVWRLNNCLKKKRGRRRGGDGPKGKPNGSIADAPAAETAAETAQESPGEGQAEEDAGLQELEETQPEAKPIKFRVTCSRAGDKHSFSSNEAARDFGGAVEELFHWKADMTKFDIEVLLNIHNEEVVIGIALTEESLHRRNITHFGPTTLRSTLCYGMLRLCKPQTSDIILDPMCGTGAIPLEGALEFSDSFYIAGDNNDMAINRTVNNICHIEKRRDDKGSVAGLPIDSVQWDLSHLPVRTSSVDIIITDMPFGKRMGSRKKNWDLYPSCLREMARVCKPGSGKAVLLTQDKKCFAKAISRMGGLWRKLHTVWVNVGGLHAGVYLLKRTDAVFGRVPEDVHQSQASFNTAGEEEEKEGLSPS